VARIVAALLALLVLAGALWATRRVLHVYAKRAGRRTVMHARVRIDRYKLTRKAYVIDALLADEAIADAVRAHVTGTGEHEDEAWRRVRRYLDEIVFEREGADGAAVDAAGTGDGDGAIGATDGAPLRALLRSRTVIADSNRIDTLLVIPL
jgi:hypothetical protein